jgi:hypothetical protein
MELEPQASSIAPLLGLTRIELSFDVNHRSVWVVVTVLEIA